MTQHFFRIVLSSIPTCWKWLTKRYLSLFSLASGAIVIILLSSRLEEIAHFVAMGAPLSKILLFVLYQIPYILQIALPIGAFTAGYVLALRMSQSGEITALRSIGKNLHTIFKPLFVVSTLLSLLTFIFLFDLAANGHYATKKLEYDVQANEPLALLQSSQFLDQHSIALDMSGSLKTGSLAKNVLICAAPAGRNRLTLALFREAKSEGEFFKGSSCTIFSTMPRITTEGAELSSLSIENSTKKSTPIGYLYEITRKKKWKVHADYLPMGSVLAMKKEMHGEVSDQRYQGKPSKNLVKKLGRFTSEPFRRLSLSFGILTLTYVGIIFGISLSRHPRSSQLAIALVPFFLFLALYLMGKNVDEFPWLAILCYLSAHAISASCAIIKKNNIEKGSCR